jgi:hypothetical protein
MHSSRLQTASTIACIAALLAATLPLTLLAQPPAEQSKPQSAAPVTPESLAGAYDGGQMEVAAQLLLKPNGHFQYELAYGALDETAEGTWELKDGAVLLTTVPAVVPPRFAVVSDTPDPKSGLWIKLVKPLMQGARQRVYLIYGPHQEADMAEVADDGSVPIPAGKHPVAFLPEIPVYPVLVKAISLTGTGGHHFVLRFEPHDLGRADFHPMRLSIEDGVLTMPRRDLELMLHFRRQQ